MERWRKHLKFDIEVSDLGRVRRTGKTPKKLSIKWSHLEGQNPLGYHVTSVGGRGIPIQRAARLVLEVFSGPAEGREARHLNGDSLDDRHDNLDWGDRMDQLADQKVHGTKSAPPISYGENNPAFRHPAERYDMAFALIEKGSSIRQAASKTGISKTQLCRRIAKRG